VVLFERDQSASENGINKPNCYTGKGVERGQDKKRCSKNVLKQDPSFIMIFIFDSIILNPQNDSLYTSLKLYRSCM